MFYMLLHLELCVARSEDNALKTFNHDLFKYDGWNMDDHFKIKT